MANWTGLYGDDNEIDENKNDLNEITNDQNDNDAPQNTEIEKINNIKIKKVSEFFADPFHWDTDDENARNLNKDVESKDDNDNDNGDDTGRYKLSIADSMLHIDITNHLKIHFIHQQMIMIIIMITAMIKKMMMRMITMK